MIGVAVQGFSGATRQGWAIVHSERPIAETLAWMNEWHATGFDGVLWGQSQHTVDQYGDPQPAPCPFHPDCTTYLLAFAAPPRCQKEAISSATSSRYS